MFNNTPLNSKLRIKSYSLDNQEFATKVVLAIVASLSASYGEAMSYCLMNVKEIAKSIFRDYHNNTQ